MSQIDSFRNCPLSSTYKMYLMRLIWLTSLGYDPLQKDILDIYSQHNTHVTMKYGGRKLNEQSFIFEGFLIHEKTSAGSDKEIFLMGWR